MPFQLNSKNIFLTYAQCNVPINDLLSWSRSFNNLEYVCVSSEVHADGSPHRHALLCFSKPFRTRSDKAFDYQGHHPNVQSAKSKVATRKYVQKDGDFVEWGEWVEKTSSESVSDDNVRDKLQLPLLDFLIWAGTNRVQYAKEIWHLANKPDINTLYDTPVVDDKYIADELWAVLKPYQHDIELNKSIVLVGWSGVGKTTWAKWFCQQNSVTPTLFCSHIDTLKQFDGSKHKSIIFDDVSFKHYPVQTQIHLVDQENPRQIHCRHTTATIPPGITKIFTCNEDPLDLEHPAVARRTTVIRCGPHELAKVSNIHSKTIQAKENQ